ncbi:hypothetical protein C8R48DRAFT_764509 [Suillus tomentosus]|nr:hypothetical protein C8R48DRAFT_764509 [Suillus tomentosus]
MSRPNIPARVGGGAGHDDKDSGVMPSVFPKAPCKEATSAQYCNFWSAFRSTVCLCHRKPSAVLHYLRWDRIVMIATQCFPSEGSGGAGRDDKDLGVLTGSLQGMILECMSQSKAVERGQSEGASTVFGVYTQHLKLIGGELTAGESDTHHEAQIISIDFDIPSTSWLHVLEAKASILGTNRPINAYNAWR